MKKLKSKDLKVMGLAPSTFGCGFAVLTRDSKLISCGVKTAKDGKKNARSLSNVRKLIRRHKPDVVAIEDATANGSRRYPRIRVLIEKIASLAKSERIKVKQYSRAELHLAFLSDERGTRHALAECLAARFPEDLLHRLPRKPRIYDSDDCRMDIFDAAALAEQYVRSRQSGQINPKHVRS